MKNRFVCWIVVIVSVLALAAQANSAAAWYSGKIQRIYLFNSGFVVTMQSTALDDCIHKYVYFMESAIGQKSVDRAYSMALTAKSSDSTFGVVIDKSINGPGGRCDSNGSADIKN